jgi:hypothetical protein
MIGSGHLREDTVPAHALMSLRGQKFGKEWDPVWAHLGVQPLDTDTAVARIHDRLSKEGFVRHPLREPTVYELLADADSIGLDQTHVARLSELVTPPDRNPREVLDHVADHLAWDPAALADWGQVIDAGPSIARTDRRPMVRKPEARAVDISTLTASLSTAKLLSGPPVPDGTTCSSKNVTGSTDGTATTAYGEFELPGQVADFADACNPAKWPLCSWFFIGMTLQPNPPKVSLSAPDDIGGNAYEAVMHEEVGMEGVLTVSTYLTCRYFVGQDSVGMEFDLAPGTHGDGKIDVDHGYLLAEQIDPNTVRVRSQKTFSFVGLDDLPFSWLCSFGWIDMMRGMATCRP